VAKKEKEVSNEQKGQKVEQKSEQKSEDSGFKINTFLQGTKEELDKVVWPSRQQLISESLAVILMVTLSATLIYLVDNFFGWAARQVF
jgi:preprotein translocase subunit SecE